MTCRLVYGEGSTHKGLNVITYLDDSHIRVTGSALLKEATFENAVTALRQAVACLVCLQPSCLTTTHVLLAGATVKRQAHGHRHFENEILNLKIGSNQFKTLSSADQRKTGEILPNHQRGDVIL